MSKQRDLKRHAGGWGRTAHAKGPDQRNVCAARHEETSYLCTRAPGHGPKKAPLHVAHTGDDAPDGSPQSLVEWIDDADES